MAVLTDDAIKLLFETGDLPTEANFRDFIDSKVNVLDYAEGLAEKADLIRSANLIDENLLTFNKFLSPLGVITNSSTYCYTGQIPVIPGESYVCSVVVRFTTLYNSAGNLISGGSQDSIPAGTVIVIPANAAFIVLSVPQTTTGSMQFERGVSSTAYSAYSVAIDPNIVIPAVENYFRESTTTAPLTLEETNWAIKTQNIFSANSAIDGFFVSSDGSITSNPAYCYSDLIPVVPGQSLICNFAIRFRAYYNSFGVVLSTLGTNNNLLPETAFVVPAGASFLRITINQPIKSIAQLEVGTEITDFVNYGFTAPDLLVDPVVLSSPWAGKIANYMGDSLTAQDSWQPSINTALNLLSSNYGVGGAKISGTAVDSMHQDLRINELSINADLIVVLGGTNDWAQSVPLGVEESVDTNTFNGALNVMIEKLTTRYPFKQIVLVTPPHSEMPGRVPGTWAAQDVNNEGHRIQAYANAIINRAAYYGIAVADANGKSGINTVNVDANMVDDGNHIHPNAEGGKRIAAVVIGLLESIKPIA